MTWILIVCRRLPTRLLSRGWSTGPRRRFYATQPDLRYRDSLKAINLILGRIRQGIGYRVLREIEWYVAHAAGLLEPKVAFDLQVRQRILPRVRGDHRIADTLNALLSHCEQEGLTRSTQKLNEMKEQLNNDGHTSFFG